MAILPRRPQPRRPSGHIPPFPAMKIALGSDHAGFAVKESLKSLLSAREGVALEDAGCSSAESCDYPDFAEKVASAVETGAVDRGILVCTTGAGMSIALRSVSSQRCS